MDSDKKLFQETAQKLINYAYEYKYTYSLTKYGAEYAQKRFYAHRIILAIIIILDIYNIIRFSGVSILDNVCFLSLFVILYNRYRKKMKKANEVLEKRNHILNYEGRINYIETLDLLAQRHPEWNVEPWWKIRNGMDFEFDGYDDEYEMEYYMSPLIVEDEDGEKFVNGEKDMDVNIVLGKEINEKLQSGKYKRLNMDPIVYYEDKEYFIAALYMHTSESKYNTYYVDANDPMEIIEKMEEYRQDLDDREREKNKSFDYLYNETNKERYERLKYEVDFGSDLYDELERQEWNDEYKRQQKEERRLASLKYQKAEYEYLVGYEHDLYFVGYLIWAGEEDWVEEECSDILICKNHIVHTQYLTKNEEFTIIETEYELSEEAKILPMPTENIISKLQCYKLGTMDYTTPRPKDITLSEWGAWIYAHISEENHI